MLLAHLLLLLSHLLLRAHNSLQSIESNPEKEPFKSKYAARSVLLDLLKQAEAKLDGTEECVTGGSVFACE